MRRTRLVVILAGALLALCLPASALAGTYAWDMPGTFTAAVPGANPDHDAYGATPWSYVESGTGVLSGGTDPSTFSNLPAFSPSTRGGLAGWSDPSATSALVADNPAAAPLTDGTDSFPSGQLVMTPAPNRVVAVGWTSPLSHPATVTVTGSVSAADPNSCPLGAYSWSLDQNGQPLQSSGSAPTGTISAAPTVPPGGAIYLTVRPTLVYDVECETAVVSLHVTEQESAGPHVTLDSPAQGALIGGGQPTVSGSASTSFGASRTVTIRVYKGTAATGAPLQTLTTTRSSSGAYSAAPTSALADGVYSAQAEQDDASAPPDVGMSTVSTFAVDNLAPTITLKSPGRKPLLTSTPTLRGVAATAPGKAHAVTLVVFRGPSTNGTPLRYLNASVGRHGAFTVKLLRLGDGQYTAVAIQYGRGAAGRSSPTTFRIKVHPPYPSVARATSQSSAELSAEFSGTAGTALGDSSTITVILRAGSSTRGKPVGTVPARAAAGHWSLHWPKPLRPGIYTVRAEQRDDVGHIGLSHSITFRVIAGPSAIESDLSISSADLATVSIRCLATAGEVCAGDVLALTVENLQPFAGGPTGPVRVLFTYVSIPAGHTASAQAPVSAALARSLRRSGPLHVRVSTSFRPGGQSAAVRRLKFTR